MIPAILALEDGHVFHGQAVGARGSSVGEIVFNTSMTGYQEIISDPSYAQQLITFTSPHLGIVGTNPEDMESEHCWAAGCIIRDLSIATSNWRSEKTFNRWLADQKVVGITGIDTRYLTSLVRTHGAMAGCIMTEEIDEAQALKQAQSFPGLLGMNLADTVSTKQAYSWTHGLWQMPVMNNAIPQDGPHILVYDFGVKRSILRQLAQQGCRIDVVPSNTSAEQALSANPDGIFLSNGPGDPAACIDLIKTIRRLIESDVPLFGVCLGHQLLGLALGAQTMKMRFGHHGGNHPVQDLGDGVVGITSQNHGFAIDDDTLPNELTVTHRSLFDGTIQGIRHQTKPIFGFQGHPEAGPGPHDLSCLFKDFIILIHEHASLKQHA